LIANPITGPREPFRHAFDLLLVNRPVAICVDAIEPLLHPFGELILAELSVPVLVAAHDSLSELGRIGTATLPRARSAGSSGPTAREGASCGTQFAAREFAVAILVQSLQCGNGALNLNCRELSIAVCVQRSHQWRYEWSAAAIESALSVPALAAPTVGRLSDHRGRHEHNRQCGKDCLGNFFHVSAPMNC
jgi:hypothetical protein